MWSKSWLDRCIHPCCWKLQHPASVKNAPRWQKISKARVEFNSTIHQLLRHFIQHNNEHFLFNLVRSSHPDGPYSGPSNTSKKLERMLTKQCFLSDPNAIKQKSINKKKGRKYHNIWILKYFQMTYK